MMKYKFQLNQLTKSLRNFTCLLLAGLLSVGSPVLAGEPVEIRTSDVALKAGGLLSGTVLNTAAQPVAGVAVSVLHDEKVVATSISNEKGDFSIKGLRNGAHIVKVGVTQQAVRLWSTNTAPPAAVENIAVVVDEEAVRGQMATGLLPGGNVGGFIAANAGGLLLVGGAVAIAVGTSLDNSAAPASP